jgi:putative addiction module component (TIGR02574 family)
MVSQADAVFQEALQLPEDARMALVERLIISMPAYRDVEEEQIREAERRLAKMKSGDVPGVAGEIVLARVQASLDARRNK